MSLVKKLGGAGVIAGAAGLLFIAGLHRVNETEVGIRTVKVAMPWGERGVVEETYGPGKHFVMPWFNDWDTLGTRLVNVEMTDVKDAGDREGDDSLKFKTIDGNDMAQNLTFAYRLLPQKAAFVYANVAQSDDELKEKIIRTVTRSRTRDLFGALTTKEYYDAAKRNEAAATAKSALNDILEPYGVVVEKVALGNYRFVNHDYASVITEKKEHEADTRTLESEILAQEKANTAALTEATGQVVVMRTQADEEYNKAKIGADAYFQEQGNIAGAILTEGKNEAESIAKAREAMASAGGRAQVQMQIAQSLSGKPIYMVPMGDGGAGGLQLQTFDVNRYLEVMGVQAAAKSTPSYTPKPAQPAKK